MINHSAKPSLREAIKRGWDWVVFTVKLISRVGGLKSWFKAIRRLVYILWSHRQPENSQLLKPTLNSISDLKAPSKLEFYPNSEFAFVNDLEINWQIIRQEQAQLQDRDFIAWSEKFLYGDGWTVFGLYAYGIKIEQNCQLCPETTKLIEGVPNLVTAAFSLLAPQTHIAAHTGYPEQVLRCHLGLFVPDRCGIRVGTQTRNWTEGQCLVFDDTFEHEAWNDSDRPRVVLLLDFKYSS